MILYNFHIHFVDKLLVHRGFFLVTDFHQLHYKPVNYSITLNFDSKYIDKFDERLSICQKFSSIFCLLVL